MDIKVKIDIASQALDMYLANGGTPLALKLLHDWAEDIRPYDPELADRLANA